MIGPVPKPPELTWTDEQWQAIAVKGDHLLVAAAAGSGKTAVLVERIIRTVSDEARPVDIDRLLVATFTNAAAAEMRHRLRDALEKALDARPSSRHLRRQLALVGRASITTLHSFCLDVVRRYVHMTDLDPSFRIANETEAALLRQEALESTMEQNYGESGEDSPFWRLVDRFGGERGDESLMRLVDRLYDFSRSHPFPERWLAEAAAAFRLDGADAVPDDHPWLSSVASDVKLELEGILASLRAAHAAAVGPGGPAAYAANLSDDVQGVERLLDALVRGGWTGLRTAVENGADALAFGRLKPNKGEAVETMVERVKKGREEAKKRLAALKEQLLTRSPADYARECRELAPLMEELARLVTQFGEAYRAAKAAKGLVDFGDLEHACLSILRDPSSTPDRLVPTEAALAFREQFEEVYVDEYQDTNAVQESVLRLVSRGDGPDAGAGNRFMVGDVKQSIYRFRLAEPGLFLGKYKTFRSLWAVSEANATDGAPGNGRRADGTSGDAPSANAPDAVTADAVPANATDGAASASADAAAAPRGIRIDLARNFRSRREVVDAVNFVFRQTMHEEAAELDYDERAELVCGAAYPEPDAVHDLAADVVLVDKASAGETGAADGEGGDDAEESVELETAELEARAIARRIALLTGAAGLPPMNVFDKSVGGKRPIAFRDIVILLRADKAWAPAFVEQLRAFGIPAHAELSGGYFDAIEIETALSLLQTIDNPLQDIPLAATLRSPIFGFTADELARIRVAGGRSGAFYEAVGRVASGDAAAEPGLREKAARFVTTLEPWRTAARREPLADLILRLYRETGYFDFVGGLPGGAQRQANLRALYDRARQYEATSFRGLFRFLRFIERMRDSNNDLAPARTLGEAEDVVRIMSIHKSKGLEFPVVFVAGLGKTFNRGDERESFLIHKSLGFGPQAIDPEAGVAYPTLPQLAIRRRLRAEALAEEMRVLYVALTRAKEKLVLVGTAKSLPDRLAAWNAAAAAEGPRLPAHVVFRGASFLDWLMPALLRHPASEPIRAAYGLEPLPTAARVADGSRWAIHAEGADALREAAPAREATAAWGMHAIEQGKPVPDDWTARDGDVMRLLGWRDPRPLASKLYAKTSVTEWKRRLEEDDDVSEAAGAAFRGRSGGSSGAAAKRPRFMEKRGLTPVERGVAYHAVMQHVPLRPDVGYADVEACLEAMVLKELLTPEQREAIQVEAVARFFESEAGRRVVRASRVFRELPFSVGLPASYVYGDAAGDDPFDAETANETVLVQGVIDCLFEDGDGLSIVDYKTDALYEGKLDELTERYRLQLGVYAAAVERSLGKPVTGKYLYFFDGSRVVKL